MGAEATPGLIESLRSGLGGLGELTRDFNSSDWQSFLTVGPANLNFENDFNNWFHSEGDESLDLK